MARAYRSTPITLKLEEAITRYTFRDTQQQQTRNLDQDVDYRNWPHTAKAISIIETKSLDKATIGVYTDRSKYQEGVGSGVVIHMERNIIARQKVNFEKRYTNKQAEQLAIHKALEEFDLLNRDGISPLTAIIYRDSRVSLDLLNNPKNSS